MGLTMVKILDKFKDCDMFSLTGKVSKYNITEEEFLKALNKIKDNDKEGLKQIYNSHKEEFKNYPDFETLYNDIEKECYEFNCEKNREYYLNKHYNDKEIEKLKQIGLTEERIEEIKQNFFHCSFIADRVGKDTKYGSDNRGLFHIFYRSIAMNIDRENSKEQFCINNGKSPLEQIPNELKKYFKYYEVSFSNSVTISSGLMINYYFELNDETKKYLLKFQNDFYLNDLEDLTLYKDNKVEFYSCTHEGFNSIEFDYKNMTNDEIIDFINDEYPEENNNEIIDIINKLINMDIKTKFSFKEIGVDDKILMNKICSVCDKINLRLISAENKEHGLSKVNENGNFEKVRELPAIFCDLEDLIKKNK